MRKILAGFAVLLWLTLSATAQDTPKVEVFGGYRYTRFQSGNFNGWNTAVTGNINSWLGITADVSGVYRRQFQTTFGTANLQVGFRQYSYLFGPTFSRNKEGTVKPYAHVLLGVSRLSSTVKSDSTTGGVPSVSNGDNAFAMALGGGVDVRVRKSLAVRPIQADYFLTRFGGMGDKTQNSVRISTGLVFRF
jgi:opacity protein-like surface antigen